eukprot:TRINITY_DN9704_c1_g1_i2.p2 TRINITY_DN9704_c1_g1~~TRINITY_DN9704_c1_g1_i2.p2  ORF type:complete len:121 (-),score=3.69 TRINITY_DN9704_c1_g1_i2:154-516(-)
MMKVLMMLTSCCHFPSLTVFRDGQQIVPREYFNFIHEDVTRYFFCVWLINAFKYGDSQFYDVGQCSMEVCTQFEIYILMGIKMRGKVSLFKRFIYKLVVALDIYFGVLKLKLVILVKISV